MIYLDISTDYGSYVHNYLTYLGHQQRYRLVGKPRRYLRGSAIGEWLVYVRLPGSPPGDPLPPK